MHNNIVLFFRSPLKHFTATAMSLGLSVGVVASLSAAPDQNPEASAEVSYQMDAVASQSDTSFAKGSLTDCIENNAMVNEIEITDSSMKKATSKASGYIGGYVDEEPSEYCALTLA